MAMEQCGGLKTETVLSKSQMPSMMLNKKKAIYNTAQKTTEARCSITASFLLNTFISKYANLILITVREKPP